MGHAIRLLDDHLQLFLEGPIRGLPAPFHADQKLLGNAPNSGQGLVELVSHTRGHLAQRAQPISAQSQATLTGRFAWGRTAIFALSPLPLLLVRHLYSSNSLPLNLMIS
jgi:hypothetical protein